MVDWVGDDELVDLLFKLVGYSVDLALPVFSYLLRPPGSTLFPYTTLFRSRRRHRQGHPRRHRWRHPRRHPRRHRRSEEHTSELQSPYELVCRLLHEKKKCDVAPDGDAEQHATSLPNDHRITCTPPTHRADH